MIKSYLGFAVFFVVTNFAYQFCEARFITGKPVKWNVAAERSVMQLGALLMCWWAGFRAP